MALLPVWLPRDLMVEVLVRLRVKPLLRFKCVCQFWRSLISHPDFINAHVKYWNNRRPFPAHQDGDNLLEKDSRTRLLSIDPSVSTCKSYLLRSVFYQPEDKNSAVDVDELPHPFTDDGDLALYILGSCNGLFCLKTWYGIVTLWNPSTGVIKQTTLPFRRYPLDNHDYTCYWPPLYGFGYDESTDDYKVVALDFRHLKGPVLADIFSLKANSWRTFPTFTTRYLAGDYPAGFLVGQALNWLILNDSKMWTLVSFDLAKEEFRLLPLALSPPAAPSFRYLSRTRPRLGVVGGQLCFFDLERRGFMDLWVMREYLVESSMELVASLEYPDGVVEDHLPFSTLTWVEDPDIDPLCIFEDAMILCKLKHIDVSLFMSLYGLKGESPRHPVIAGVGKDRKVGIYVESLVSPYPYGSTESPIVITVTRNEQMTEGGALEDDGKKKKKRKKKKKNRKKRRKLKKYRQEKKS